MKASNYIRFLFRFVIFFLIYLIVGYNEATWRMFSLATLFIIAAGIYNLHDR